jgi:hypothetical protein
MQGGTQVGLLWFGVHGLRLLGCLSFHDSAGNSLGTAVANVVLLAALGQKVQESAADFTVLRLLEDWHYQSVVRQLLKECAPR